MWAARNWDAYLALEEDKLVEYGIDREYEEEFQLYDPGGGEEAQEEIG